MAAQGSQASKGPKLRAGSKMGGTSGCQHLLTDSAPQSQCADRQDLKEALLSFLLPHSHSRCYHMDCPHRRAEIDRLSCMTALSRHAHGCVRGVCMHTAGRRCLLI